MRFAGKSMVMLLQVLGSLSEEVDVAREKSVVFALFFLVTGLAVGTAMFLQVRLLPFFILTALHQKNPTDLHVFCGRRAFDPAHAPPGLRGHAEAGGRLVRRPQEQHRGVVREAVRRLCGHTGGE